MTEEKYTEVMHDCEPLAKLNEIYNRNLVVISGTISNNKSIGHYIGVLSDNYEERETEGDDVYDYFDIYYCPYCAEKFIS